MTVNIVAVITAREGQQDAIVSALQQAAPDFHADEGCLLYAPQRSGSRKVVVIESYADKEALTRHAEHPTFKAMGKQLADLVEGPTDITMCTPAPAGDSPKGAL